MNHEFTSVSDKVIPDHRRGRGAVTNRSSRFDSLSRQPVYDSWAAGAAHRRDDDAECAATEAYDQKSFKTHVAKEYPKTIITKNKSPDIPFDRSINPYRGCEHGCTYCYARPSHNYMGLSAGLDFERRLFAKEGAADLLRAELSKRNYQVSPIALGSNTDPYQPIEKEMKITRQILKVLNEFNHPVTILTKSRLIVRDLDILSEMAVKKLVKVSLSVTTLDAKLARQMEPRAATPQKRLDAIRLLSGAGVPTGAMFAPLIPGLNDHEMEKVLEAVAHAGAKDVGYILLRLPQEVKDIFEEWLEEYFPDRKKKILSRLYAMRDGRANDPRFGKRMKGSGYEAEMIARRFAVHTRRLRLNLISSPVDTNLYMRPIAHNREPAPSKASSKDNGQQLSLFS